MDAGLNVMFQTSDPMGAKDGNMTSGVIDSVEEEEENVRDDDADEVSLKHFYSDLEKQLLKNYSDSMTPFQTFSHDGEMEYSHTYDGITGVAGVSGSI